MDLFQLRGSTYRAYLTQQKRIPYSTCIWRYGSGHGAEEQWQRRRTADAAGEAGWDMGVHGHCVRPWIEIKCQIWLLLGQGFLGGSCLIMQLKLHIRTELRDQRQVSPRFLYVTCGHHHVAFWSFVVAHVHVLAAYLQSLFSLPPVRTKRRRHWCSIRTTMMMTGHGARGNLQSLLTLS